jgi:hypothetical protein
MEKARVGWSWGAAAAIIVVILGVLAILLWYSPPAKGQRARTASPPVVIQWQPQSDMETKLRARVAADNTAILGALEALAAGKPDKEFTDVLARTYLHSPRFMNGGQWVEGTEGVLKALKGVFRDHKTAPGTIDLDSVSALIELQAYAGATEPGLDTDAVATIQLTFSASPGGNILEGGLKHSRICEWN